MTKTKKSTPSKKAAAAELTLNSPEIIAQTHKDMLHSALFLSVLLNLFVFITWVVIRVTSQFDAELVSVIFSR